jgi:hypothetical protein
MGDLIPILQIAVGPVILISGVGLLLLSMTNRFGRIIDRSRTLAQAIRTGTDDDRRIAQGQIPILWRRALLVRRAIAFASVSLLLAAVLVIVLFLGALEHVDIAGLVIGLFSACLLTLIISLVAFIQEINQSLSALKVDLFGSAPADGA